VDLFRPISFADLPRSWRRRTPIDAFNPTLQVSGDSVLDVFDAIIVQEGRSPSGAPGGATRSWKPCIQGSGLPASDCAIVPVLREGGVLLAKDQVSNQSGFLSEYLVVHEFIHALGFGHTCFWPSVMQFGVVRESETHRECRRAFLAPEGDPLVFRPTNPTVAAYPEDVAHIQLLMDAADLLRSRWRGEMVMYLYDTAVGDQRFRHQLSNCVHDHERFCIER
jgi:hypothetical protein